jgi:hypothetical protein
VAAEGTDRAGVWTLARVDALPTFRDGLGQAFDAFGAESDMRAFGAFVDRWAPQVDEGIHNPGLSRKNGNAVPASFWGSATWSAHHNHVHIGNA